MVAFVGNTNVLKLRGLKSALDDEYINDATVSVTVKTVAGVNVTGQTWPTTMGYVANSDGDYRALLESDLAVVAGVKYLAFIEANAGGEAIGHWEFEFIPKTRRL